MASSGYAFALGGVLLGIGLIFRFSPRASGRWRYAAALIAIPFGIVPYSLIPWGCAVLLLALSKAAASAPLQGLTAFGAVLAFTVGVIVMFTKPSWLRPRSFESTH